MSLWRGRRAPGMLTCGEAALTTIDKKRVRRLSVIGIPGGGSFIGGRLTRGPGAAVGSFLSGSSLSLKRVICLLRALTKKPIRLLFTSTLISVRAKNALNHQLRAFATNMEQHGRLLRSNVTLWIYFYNWERSHSLETTDLTWALPQMQKTAKEN